MKKVKSLIILLVLLIAVIGTSVITGYIEDVSTALSYISVDGKVIFKLLEMIIFVVLLAELIKLILSSIKVKNHKIRTLISVLVSASSYIAAIVIICWGLVIFGFDLNTVFASVGLLALVVGFGAESLIEDVITGLFILFESQYAVGDIVEIDGFRGVVDEIGIRTTSIKDTSNNIKIINNSQMKNILNKSSNVSKAVCDFPVPYNTDLIKLEEQLADIVTNIYESNKDMMKDIPKYWGVQELGDSAIVLRFTADVEEKNIFQTTRILNRELLLQLRAAGIECPYTQLDIHSK